MYFALSLLILFTTKKKLGGDEPLGSQIPSMFFNYIGSDIDWKFNTEPEKNACLSSPEQRCYWPRGKVLGGTSGE